MNIPIHVAIIMDGNGRWASSQNKPRSYGHYVGSENVKIIADKALEMGVKYLTLYAFSTENWKRPDDEVQYLMDLPAIFFKKFLNELKQKGIRVETIGDLDAFPDKTRKVIEDAKEETKDNDNLTLIFAMNFGGRQDIVNGINNYVDDVQNGNVSGPLSEEVFNNYLSTAAYPEVDLMIRTSLDYRLSNFLLWQLSYAELYFVDKYWPEFSEQDFEEALEDFSQRKRRFGGL